MWPLGSSSPSPRRRRPRRQAERARVDRPLPRPARCCRRTSALTICAPSFSPCEVGLALCVKSKSGQTVSRHGISRSRCADTSRYACCSNVPLSTRPRANSPSVDPCRSSATALRDQLPVAAPPTAIERAWPLFHIAQLCGLDPSIVEQWTAAARDGARIRTAPARRCAPASHPAPGVRASDSSSPVRRAHAPHTAAASRAAGVPGDFLPRRAGGIVSPTPGGGRASLRDVQHRRVLQRGDVSRRA